MSILSHVTPFLLVEFFSPYIEGRINKWTGGQLDRRSDGRKPAFWTKYLLDQNMLDKTFYDITDIGLYWPISAYICAYKSIYNDTEPTKLICWKWYWNEPIPINWYRYIPISLIYGLLSAGIVVCLKTHSSNQLLEKIKAF